MIEWSTDAGYVYRIARSVDLQSPGIGTVSDSVFFPDLIYGAGGTQSFPAFSAPTGGAPPAGPVNQLPQLLFFISAFDNGSAVIRWTSDSGLPVAHYLADFDVREAGTGNVVSGYARITLQPPAVTGWKVDAFVSAVSYDSAFASLSSPPEEASVLARISGYHGEILTALQTGNTVSTQTGGLSDRQDIGREFYRVYRHQYDSDLDGTWDHDELSAGSDPYGDHLADSDGDSVPDVWQRIDRNGDGTLDPAQLLISEFSAVNDRALADEDGEFSDWVELYNATATSINLSGWSLACDDVNPSANAIWAFPAGLSIAPGTTLIVFASGKNRTNPQAELHTTFKLDGDGELIQLLDANGNEVDKHVFGPQRADISGGWAPDPFTGKLEALRYFETPTPGALNTSRAYLGWTREPVFSTNGGVFSGGQQQVSLSPTTAGSHIYYTTNAAAPTLRSPIFSSSLELLSSTIVRAMAVVPGFIPSRSVTHSYLFTDDVVGTAAPGTPPTDAQVRPPGYPDQTSVSSYLIDYAMDPAVLGDSYTDPTTNTTTALSTLITDSLLNQPTVSIVAPVADLFGQATAGIYANSNLTKDQPDPPGADIPWERAGSFEFIDPSNGSYTFENAGLRMNGRVNRQHGTTMKHNMRAVFRKRYSRFADLTKEEPQGHILFDNQAPFTASSVEKFDTLILRQPTQDSWAITHGLFGSRREEALYAVENWSRSTHKQMGWLTAQSRWVQLWINGVYWGPYSLSERVDEDFLKSNVNDDVTFDVLSEGEASAGDLVAWNALGAAVTAAAASPSDATLFADVTSRLNLENYIDYLLINFYAHHLDWPGGNWRAYRQRPDGSFQFMIWDTEFAMVENSQNADPVQLVIDAPNKGAAAFFVELMDHPQFQAAFRARVALHFSSGGVWQHTVATGVHAAATALDTAAAKFEPFIHAESARWGDVAKTPAYRRSDTSYRPNDPIGDWDRNRIQKRDHWIPQRRGVLLNHLRSNNRNLAPAAQQ